MTNDSSDCFTDSNVLIYSLDPSDKPKQRRAIELLTHLVVDQRVVVSAQCLTETFNGLTRRIPQPLSQEQALAHIDQMIATFRVVDLSADIVRAACAATSSFQMSIWDAMIWSAAKSGSATVILTEDTQSRGTIEGVRYINPFAPDFNIETL